MSMKLRQQARSIGHCPFCLQKKPNEIQKLQLMIEIIQQTDLEAYGEIMNHFEALIEYARKEIR